MSKENNENKKYGFAALMSDIIAIAIIIFILDCCGCGICNKAASLIGEAVNEYGRVTSQNCQ